MRRGAIMAFAVALTLVSTTSLSFADKLTDAQKQYNSLRNQTQSTQKNIANLKAQEHQLQSKIVVIEGAVNNLQKNIVTTQADLERRNQQINQLKGQIAQAEQQLQTQYDVLQQRVRVMYEAGNTSYLDVLFSATSFADLLDRFQLLSDIAAQDKQMLNNIQATKATLDTANQTLEQQQAKQKSLYNDLQTKKSQQENFQNQELVYLGQVHDKRLKEQADLQNETAAMANLKSLIQQLEASMGQYTGPASGWTWPVPGHHSISSGYGWRTWSDGSREFHNGIDIPAPLGAPMVAATSGKVLYAGPASGFGDWIVIESAGGLLEIYGHMYSYEIKVYPGEIVHEGQQIASVGSNGMSTGPHLHFTIATGFNASGYPVSVNPLKYV